MRRAGLSASAELLVMLTIQTSLLQTCGHRWLTHRTSTRLTMSSGQSCSSVCIRPESMTWRAATASYHRVVWTGTACCGWRHWSVATSSIRAI